MPIWAVEGVERNATRARTIPTMPIRGAARTGGIAGGPDEAAGMALTALTMPMTVIGTLGAVFSIAKTGLGHSPGCHRDNRHYSGHTRHALPTHRNIH